MANKFKNEMEIELAGEKILLRPTFENMAKMESDLGGISYLAFKYTAGVDTETKTITAQQAAKAMPPVTEAAKIIFYNQAEKKFTLDQIYEMMLSDGVKASVQAVLFLARCTAGNKLAQEPSSAQKKS